MLTHQTNLASPGSAKDAVPEWLYQLPGMPRLIDRLGATEFRRRLFHMLPALLPIGLPFTPHNDVWETWLIASACSLAIIALIMAVFLAPLVVRPHEEQWMAAVFGYIVPMLSVLLLFPGRAELALMTLQIVALGDGSAVLAGKMVGGKTLPWNHRKTFSGLLGFIVIGSLAATCSYLGEAHPPVTLETALLICGVAATCAGIVESLPLKSNDNFRVGMTAAIVGAAMSSWSYWQN